MEKIRVIIADKQIFFRDGLHHALSQETDLEILECDPTQHLIEAIGEQAPEVLILDIDHPSLSGLWLTRRILRHSPATGVILLSPEPSEEELIEVVRSGAAAYLNKNTGSEELGEAIRRVAQHEYPIDDILAETPDAAEQVLRQFRDVALLGKVTHFLANPLTFRETQVLDCIAKGKSNKQIGATLQISEQTVKSHVSAILRRLNASHRAHAVALAMRDGWIGTEDNVQKSLRPDFRHQLIQRKA